MPQEHVELPTRWSEFETTLGKYKMEYKQKLNQARNLEKEVEDLVKDIEVLTDSVLILHDSNAKKEISEVRDRYKIEHGFQDKQNELSRLLGECKKMETILEETNAKNYTEFTCSVCMDRKVDHFLDPCGHMICIFCFVRTRSNTCPTCRTTVQPRKIYLTM